MSNIRLDLGLSTRQTLKLGKDIREATDSRKSVEPNLKSKLKDIDHTLDDYFDTKGMYDV